MTDPPAARPAHKDRALALLKAHRLPLLILAAQFALFFLARLLLLLIHRGDFASLSGGQTAWGFVRGLRFDGAMIFLFAGIPILLLMLPFPWAQRNPWQAILGWTCFAEFMMFAFVLGVDVVYFGYVHRHAGPEVTFLGEALEAVAHSGMVQYLLPILAFLAAGAGLFFAWRRMMRMELSPLADRWARAVLCVLAFWLMYSGSRGTFWGKRTKIVHAFEGVPQPAAYLALNGPFSILHSLDYAKPAKTGFFPWDEAVRTAQGALLAPDETATNPDYPLLRARPAKQARKPNVVVIMLESWNAFTTDAHRREMGLPPLGLTPAYDAISREGVLFPRFYASGQKSMDGLSALLCGFPTMPRTPYLGRGMEQSSLPFLGLLAKQEGYDTIFVQSSRRDSFRNDAIAAMAGFTTYLGSEDIPPAPTAAGGKPPSRSILAGAAWDHEMFAEADRRLAAGRKPFLAFLYTASTHAPFAWPDATWEKFPPDSMAHRYYDSLAYGDWALGRFFAAAKASGYFDSTVFILAADHISGPTGATLEDPPTLHHIPGLVLAPGLAPGVDRRIGCQLDVIPTIAHLAGWGAPHSSVGRSLFSEPAAGGAAFCVQGEVILRVEEGGYVSHNLGTRVSAKGPDPDGTERRLLSIYQVAATLLRRNRLHPSTGARKE